MTEADAITRVRERLDESLGSSSQRYTTADLTEYIQDGARQYIAFTGCQYSRVTVTAEAYVQLYDLPCDFIQVERVLWKNGSTFEPLEPVHFKDMDKQYYQWQRMTDTRARCYYRFSSRRIGLWPTHTAAGEQYIVHYQQDIYNNLAKVPVEDHDAIVDYTLARCLLATGHAVDGAKRYGAFAKIVEAGRRRRSSLDRSWAMSGRGSIGG